MTSVWDRFTASTPLTLLASAIGFALLINGMFLAESGSTLDDMMTSTNDRYYINTRKPAAHYSLSSEEYDMTRSAQSVLVACGVSAILAPLVVQPLVCVTLVAVKHAHLRDISPDGCNCTVADMLDDASELSDQIIAMYVLSAMYLAVGVWLLYTNVRRIRREDDHVAADVISRRAARAHRRMMSTEMVQRSIARLGIQQQLA